jgi:sn-glycerol 3-phosphate transport system ATP-binding protein
VGPEGAAVALPGGFRLPLNGSPHKAHAGKKVILGVRPEHLEVCREPADGLALRVEQVELLGADTLVHGSLGAAAQRLTVRLADVHRFEKHAVLPLTVSPRKIHLFDPETKKRIGGEGPR